MDIKIVSEYSGKPLGRWRHAFFENIATLKTHYDERFFRMWKFYITGCGYFFQSQPGIMFQLGLDHNHKVK